MSERKKYAIIVAGGSGTRLKSKTPKQFLEIGGKPILRHTIEKFLSLPFKVELIIVVASDMKEYWKAYCENNLFLDKYYLPSGGMTRFHSVANALKYVDDNSVVAVHDGVRPFVTTEFLEMMYMEGERTGAAVPAVAPCESVREVCETDSYPLVRENVRLIQTPQVFRSEILKASYRLPYTEKFTDDASVVEAAGFNVSLVEGLKYNIKITTPEDFRIAQTLLG
ncbi:MAG: 2-C-methyl-D-erythritol 4-phosphate cytidylyltransferase [Bacteroidales bacterium]|nr:2-C-methyl-D-erythritol 4-phosphate cytidylyltransferase [Candidatus Equibacterium intestinale]